MLDTVSALRHNKGQNFGLEAEEGVKPNIVSLQPRPKLSLRPLMLKWSAVISHPTWYEYIVKHANMIRVNDDQ